MVKRSFSYLVIMAVFNLILVTSGFCWGSATHAFMARSIGWWNIYPNFQEMYGLMAPDLFNYNFDLAGAIRLSGLLPAGSRARKVL
ncbi:MAG: hypothetical protein QME28_01765 [Candidatus Saccharicenans sp.]|nr:hypothetical protein [Candidatus Saccharicenans sp.]